MSNSKKPSTLVFLFFSSLLEAFILPIPIDAVTVPLMLSDKKRILNVVTVAAAGSVIGGVFGYFVGFFFFEEIGVEVMTIYGYEDEFWSVQKTLNENAFPFLLVGCLTPIPFKIVTIAAGVVRIPFWGYFMIVLFARLLRFSIFGLFFWFFGERAKILVERNLNYVGWLMVAVLVFGFLMSGWL